MIFPGWVKVIRVSATLPTGNGYWSSRRAIAKGVTEYAVTTVKNKSTSGFFSIPLSRTRREDFQKKTGEYDT